ncbi:glycosyltransferase family 2 protein [Geofilum rhodophaeum]|uniref:glycosyltransferase family 2 protein n=1 Tax=Geofilum rhodophaeum TaxID=1965019 RepID=UPI000B5208C7|nr:glycosyltransferase [Geofilum rhodophaeum]
MITLAVLLTIHNRKDKTLECLRALFKCDLPSNIVLDVIITDDGSDDGSGDAVKKCFPQVSVLKGDGTLFWNRGMLNSWVSALKIGYDLFLWLNDDTILQPYAINALVQGHIRHHKAIIIGASADPLNESVITYGGRRKARNYPMVTPSLTKDVLCDTFNGNIVLVPQFVVNEIGILDSYFRHSFGDIEYGLRASKYGVRSVLVPGIVGFCSRDVVVPVFRQKGRSLISRYKLLYSPLGYNPFEEYYLNRKYFSFFKSIWWFLKIHMNVLFVK